MRAIQLAKAALYAGARLLMERFGVGAPQRIALAGAFGSHIDPKYAMVLGMIPDCALVNVAPAGNAAGTGARIALLNRAARAEIEGVVRRIEKIETAIEPRFQEHFVAAMAFPHASDDFTNLAKAIALPERRGRGRGGGEGGSGTLLPRAGRKWRGSTDEGAVLSRNQGVGVGVEFVTAAASASSRRPAPSDCRSAGPSYVGSPAACARWRDAF